MNVTSSFPQVVPKCSKSRALNALKGKGLFFKETYACLEAKKAIRPISHSAFQETACTTVYKRDGNSDAFLGDTKCEGIPVEVSLSLSLSMSHHVQRDPSRGIVKNSACSIFSGI